MSDRPGPRHIVVLRHGETALSRSGAFVGSTDCELSETGAASATSWAQTFATAGAVSWSSPLIRAAETARRAGLDPIIVEDLREWELGALEGLNAHEYRSANPGWSLFVDGPPDCTGESTAAAAARAADVVGRAIATDAEIMVLVGHGQFSRAISAAILGLPISTGRRLSWGPARAAVFTYRASIGDYALAGWNRTPQPIEELLTGNE